MNEDIGGMLPIAKSRGMTSKDVSRWLVRNFGPLKIGHVGTLDPEAEGVLPLLIGRATRFQDYLLSQKKAYECEMEFGFETTTLDLEGAVTKRASWDHITEDKLDDTLKSFLGVQIQIPPVFSAVKFKGKALYEYARAGRSEQIPVESLGRQIEIDGLSQISWQPPKLSFRIECSKGTYIRSLVRDLGVRLGSCATMTKLVRTKSAGLTLDRCVTLDDIYTHCHGLEGAAGHAFSEAPTRKFAIESLRYFILPVAQLKLGLDRWEADSLDMEMRLLQGQAIEIGVQSYLERFQDRDHANVSDNNAILLINRFGSPIGIVASKMTDHGRIQIQMKRGL